ncbi:MAG: acetylornithine/succinylornithine family transaminase [Phycisphaeraceae bacterium]|nr:acetylornithine/succinylornithine family transaminase [Phycisphaeraceae bacterium]
MATTAAITKTQEIIERHEQFMEVNLPRYAVAMVRGEGCRLWDAEGKEYLDLFAGFGGSVLGHCHPEIVKAVNQQARTLWHVGNLLHTEPQTLLAETIAKHGFGGKSFFCHSGADANEAAIKIARLHGHKHPGKNGPRYKIISMLNSFHGRSFATMMATGQEKVRHGFEPWLNGFINVPFNDLEAIRNVLDNETIGILVEPIQGEGGCNIPDDNYFAALRKLCDERNMVLIFDEVWTGCGRTGKFFAHQHWGVIPDVMTLAKGVGGGLAVGVMCAGPRVWDHFDYRKHGMVAHATTLGGNCLSMAVSARIFEVIERDGLLANATTLGEHVVDRLTKFRKKCSAIKQIRGKGLFLGIELNPSAKDAWFKSAADVVNKCMEQGVLINGTQNTVLRLAPPIVITRKELDHGLDVIEAVIAG